MYSDEYLKKLAERARKQLLKVKEPLSAPNGAAGPKPRAAKILTFPGRKEKK